MTETDSLNRDKLTENNLVKNVQIKQDKMYENVTIVSILQTNYFQNPSQTRFNKTGLICVNVPKTCQSKRKLSKYVIVYVYKRSQFPKIESTLHCKNVLKLLNTELWRSANIQALLIRSMATYGLKLRANYCKYGILNLR